MKNVCVIYLLVLITPLFAQSNFKIISSDISLSNDEKNKSFDSLMLRYSRENKIDSLIIETYDIQKWHYTETKNIEKAIKLNRRNLDLMDSINYKDRILYRRNVYSLGSYLYNNNEIENALKTLKTLLNYNEPDKYAFNSSFKIAEIYYDVKGDYYKSLEYYKFSRLLAEKLKDDTLLTISTLGIGKSNLLINTTNSIDEAISTTSNTIAYLESSPTNSVDEYYLIKIYKLLGNLYSDREDYNFEIATLNFDKALNIAIKTGYTDEVSFINNDIGLIYLKDKRPEAEIFFNKALEYRRDNVMYGVIKRNLAQHYLDFKDYDQALQSIQQSIEALNLKRSDSLAELPTKERLKSNKFNNQLISSLIVKSDIWLKLAEINTNKDYYYEQAIKTIKLGDWLIDIARLSDIEYRSKLFWRKTANNLYLKAVELYYRTDNPEEAFYYFEKSKAIQLLEDVNLKSVRANTQIPIIISNKEELLKAKIIDLEQLISSTPTETVSRDLIIARENYDVFIDTLDTNLKLLYKLEKPAEVIDIKTLKDKYLSPKKVYIEYILDNEDGYGLLISKGELILFEIPNIDQLKNLSVNYRKHLNTPITNGDDLQLFNETSHALYNILFPEDIRGALNDKIITIIPDNYLQNMPFESLITSNTDNESFLIFKNEINYSYSITFLIKNKALRKGNNNGIIGFAPVDFKDNLSSLANTKEELESLNNLSSSNLFQHKDANKANFYKISENAKIIHIASHANASDNISPWISFHDEKLYLNELYNHTTSADLVVLSACNTSLGEIYRGEGVMSLARGFFHSGSQSVLTTLWTVNDKSTSFLMKDFYQNLESGETKSAALRNAKLNYLKSHSLSEASPYYWSSFILLGDSESMDLDSGLTLLHYSILGSVLLIALFLYFRHKKK